MLKPFCENPYCILFGKDQLEVRGLRVHNEDIGRKIESREYSGLRFCSLCCPNEASVNAIIERHFKEHSINWGEEKENE